jgi:hypothetical protein
MTLTLISLAVIVFAIALFVFRAIPGVRAFFTYRGKRLVTCPETHKPEAVDVDVHEAALGAFLNQPTLRLRECSRWPVRQNCGQECLRQIEIDPKNCLLWNVVSRWYEGKRCVFCHKRIGALHHLDHAPALLAPDHNTLEWNQIKPEQLPEIFETYRPVCWNCHVTETFLRTRPELVVKREDEPLRIR